MNYKTNLCLFILLISGSGIMGQTWSITQNGDSILIHDNGTQTKLSRAKLDPLPLLGSVEATVETDQFQKIKIVQTEKWDRFAEGITNHNLSGSLREFDGLMTIAIQYSHNVGCLSQYSSSLRITLTNGEIIECAQLTNTNCGNSPMASFAPLTRDQLKDPNFQKIMDQNIDLLATFDWEMIRISGPEFITDMSPKRSKTNPNPEQFFRQHIRAIKSK